MDPLQTLRAVVGLDLVPLEQGLARAEALLERFSRNASTAANSASQATSTAASRAISDVERVADRAQSRVGDLLDRMKSRSLALTVAVTTPLTALGTNALRSAVSMESLMRGLEATAGSAAAAREQVARLTEVAKLPGLGFREAVQGSIALQNAGFSARQAEQALMQFGNALTLVGKGKNELDGVTLALQQIASKGKISAEEINQLSERVPQIRKAMQEAFGTADTEVLQKAGISANQFVDGVTAALARLPRASSGTQTSLENLADKLDSTMSRIGAKALPTLVRLAELGERLLDGFNKLPGPVQAAAIALAGLAALAGPVAGLAGSVRSLVAGLGGLAGVQGALGAARVGLAGLAGGAGAAALGTVGAGAAALGIGGGAGYMIQEHLLPDSAQRRRDRANLSAAEGAIRPENSPEAQNARRKARGLPYFENGRLIRPDTAAPAAAAPLASLAAAAGGQRDHHRAEQEYARAMRRHQQERERQIRETREAEQRAARQAREHAEQRARLARDAARERQEQQERAARDYREAQVRMVQERIRQVQEQARDARQAEQDRISASSSAYGLALKRSDLAGRLGENDPLANPAQRAAARERALLQRMQLLARGSHGESEETRLDRQGELAGLRQDVLTRAGAGQWVQDRRGRWRPAFNLQGAQALAGRFDAVAAAAAAQGPVTAGQPAGGRGAVVNNVGVVIHSQGDIMQDPRALEHVLQMLQQRIRQEGRRQAPTPYRIPGISGR